MANSQDPHRPFAGSEAELNAFGKHLAVSRTIKPSEVQIPTVLSDLPDVRKELGQYYTSSHRCDETVGEVLRALRESGLEDNTVVMFLSDNGISEPFAKTNCYMNSTTTPWIVRWPGQAKTGNIDHTHFISGIDFMPTILEIAGLPQVKGMDGKSFMPLLKGKPQAGRGHVLTTLHATSGRNEYPMRCLRTTHYSYLFNAWADGKRVFRNEPQGGLAFQAMQASTDLKIAERVKFFLYRTPEELYDLDADPNELHNLAKDPKHQQTLKQMRAQLLEEMVKTQDLLREHLQAWVKDGKLTWQPSPAQPRRPRAGAGRQRQPAAEE